MSITPELTNETLKALCRGMTVTQMALRANVTNDAVRSRLYAIRAAYGVPSTIAAVVYLIAQEVELAGHADLAQQIREEWL